MLPVDRPRVLFLLLVNRFHLWEGLISFGHYLLAERTEERTLWVSRYDRNRVDGPIVVDR